MKRLVVAIGLAAGCAKAGAGGGGFRVFYPDAEQPGAKDVLAVRAGKPFQARPAADCRNAEGNEGRWANTGARVIAGELPPALTIEDGAIAGTPTAAGEWRVTIKFTGVTCSAAPMPDQDVSVTIKVSNGK